MADSVERCEFTEDTLTKHVREPYIIATDGKCDYLRIRRQRIELRGLGFAGIDIDVALMVRLEHVRRYRSAAGYESEGTELPGGGGLKRSKQFRAVRSEERRRRRFRR